MQTYQKKSRGPSPRSRSAPQAERTAPLPMDALRSALAYPSTERLGERMDLPSQIQAKMERAFGVDFSAVRLYRSQAVADAGVEAAAQGRTIAFAPGRLDFFSRQGQELLGHELSHVASQARGEVRGRGFLDNAALESRADQEGALAARGEGVGPAAGLLPSVSAVGASGPIQAKKPAKKQGGAQAAPPQAAPPQAAAQEEEMPELAEQSGFDPVRTQVGAVVDAFNGHAGSFSGNVKELADDKEGPAWLQKRASRLSNSKSMNALNKTLAVTGTVKSAYDLYKNVEDILTGRAEGDAIDQGAGLLASLGSAATTATQGVNELIPKGNKFHLDDATSSAVGGGGQLVGGSLQTLNSMRHLYKAIQDDDGEGGQFEQILTAGSGILGGSSDIVQGLSKATKRKLISKDSAGQVGAALQIGSGAITTAGGVHQIAASGTDKDLAKSALAKVRNGSAGRTTEEQQSNDALMDNVLSAQQRTARVHMVEGRAKVVHGLLDVAGGGASFLPTIGTAASIGAGTIQRVADYIGDEVTNKEKKLMRETNLGGRHMRLRQGVTDQLVQRKKAEKAAQLGKPIDEVELTAYELDECQKLAKHTVNKKLYNGASTNKMANMQKTNAELTRLEDLMQQKENGELSGEAKLAAKRMGSAGHAVKDGALVDRNAAMAKLNADLDSGTSFEDAWAENVSKEHLKYNPVLAAKEKANAKKEEERRYRERYGGQWKDKLEQARKRQKDKAKQDAEAKKSTRKERRKASSEARDAAKEKLRQEQALQKQNQENYINNGLRLAAARNGGKELGFFDRRTEKARLEAEFQARQGDGGGARALEAVAEGTASATAGKGLFGRAKDWVQGKYFHWKRNHDRVRDSMVNDGWEELGKWDRFKLSISNPLAWLTSKFEAGKAKSRARRGRQAGWDALANTELERLMAGLDSGQGQ